MSPFTPFLFLFPLILTVSAERTLPLFELSRQFLQKGPGATFDPCVFTSQCISPRTCRTISRKPCDFDSICVCTPPLPNFCVTPSQCISEEMCVQAIFNLNNICVSKVALVSPSFSDPVPVPVSGDGFTLARCTQDSQCLRDRKCRGWDGTAFGDCRKAGCYGVKNLSRCFTKGDCIEGEVCANTPVSSTPICVSDLEAGRTASITIVTLTPATGMGYTLDPCREDSDCKGVRKCRLFSPRADFKPCLGMQCVCVELPRPSCRKQNDCVLEEVCARYELLGGKLCVSVRARAAYKGLNAVKRAGRCPVLIPFDNAILPMSVRTRNLPTTVDVIGGFRTGPNAKRSQVFFADSFSNVFCSGYFAKLCVNCGALQSAVERRGRVRTG